MTYNLKYQIDLILKISLFFRFKIIMMSIVSQYKKLVISSKHSPEYRPRVKLFLLNFLNVIIWLCNITSIWDCWTKNIISTGTIKITTVWPFYTRLVLGHWLKTMSGIPDLVEAWPKIGNYVLTIQDSAMAGRRMVTMPWPSLGFDICS